ncbi:MAG: protein-glutamate O-methyltransferase CheR [Gammaproteobacteria bacterium]|nr:protein-glutamate O-methyltransferase CheR [Gammaproteobacteria bacterium]MBU2059306.1 protein-glutamate O-methyltransferase CheR [Gammaproteobacteria bacterium]MBU2175314.1 protein-glutamate O-methyltransferase CheR [Gammaproteobacteria bacterium]MBU2247522.1 protein-glutamate O-methyltransferase CheR [Gammaproteobacteria bacterium]MBU2342718.1 protein-glutamate O-methyltransferase CheR [Gammaproteobacteria bacterium]
MVEMPEQCFHHIRQWLYQQSGIHLSVDKKSMVSARLQKRLRHLQLTCFEQYLHLLNQHDQTEERQLALNSLTTNETYFFREQAHFEFLCQHLAVLKKQASLRIWSAAASTGEEAYSLAMLLAEQLGLLHNWRLTGTDINNEVLEQAKKGVYDLRQTERIARSMLQAYCLKGVGKDQGKFMLRPELRAKVDFRQANLMDLPALSEKFDVIFLRNILIYFKLEDKKHIVNSVLKQLKPGGLLIVGHTESINGYHPDIKLLQPSCYRWK